VQVTLGTIIEKQDDDDDPDTPDKNVEIEGPATTIDAVIARINSAIEEATGGAYGITAEINATGTGITINDNGNTTMEISVSEVKTGSVTGTTAADLGLLVVQGTSRDGERIFAGLNTTLVKNLNGSSGLLGDGMVTFTDRNGVGFTSDINGLGTVSEIVAQINVDAISAGADINIALNGPGTGLLVTDSSGGTGNLIIGGGSAGDLGIETDVAGVADDSVLGTSLQHAYVTSATQLSSLNGGKGIGTGKFRITDSFGRIAQINIGANNKTIAELVQQINGQAGSKQLEINARINDAGDGIVIEEDAASGNGTQAIKIEDVDGVVARRLNIAGEASGVDGDNHIDGSYESRITFEATDTLDDVIKKINESGAHATVSIINDGTAANPYRLSIAARETGNAGRFTFDTKGFDLGLNIMDEGHDAKAFFGSDDPAKAVLLLSSTNTLDGVLNGVSINMKRESDTPIELTITSDSEAIELAVQEFVTAFNEVVGRIDEQTSYDSETKQRGILLGDSTVIGLRQQLFNTVLSQAEGFTGTYSRLIEVGIEIGDGGTIEFNAERFREAMSEDAESVAALFETRTLVDNSAPVEISPGVFVTGGNKSDEFSALGVVGRIEQLAKSYVDSIDGVLTLRKNSLDAQIKAQEKRIADFDVRLEQKREILARQFLAMEKAIGRMSSQQQALGSMSFGLFLISPLRTLKRVIPRTDRSGCDDQRTQYRHRVPPHQGHVGRSRRAAADADRGGDQVRPVGPRGAGQQELRAELRGRLQLPRHRRRADDQPPRRRRPRAMRPRPRDLRVHLPGAHRGQHGQEHRTHGQGHRTARLRTRDMGSAHGQARRRARQRHGRARDRGRLAQHRSLKRTSGTRAHSFIV